MSAADSAASAAAKKHVLYWNPLCPFVHRTLITMEEKGCADVPERVFIALGKEKPSWYADINPRATVPMLIVDGQTPVFESAFVAEYFDREFGPRNALLPAVPAVRNQIREFQSVCGDMIGALYRVFFSDDKEKATVNARAAVAKAEAALKANVDKFGGPYFLGQHFSMADIHVVPFLQRFSVTLPAFRDFDPLADAPCLAAMNRQANLRPSVFNTSQTPQEYISGYATYGGKDAPKVRPVVRLSSASPFGQRISTAIALAELDVEVQEVDAAAAKDERLPQVSAAGTTVHDSNNGMLYLLESLRKSDKATGPLIPADDVLYGRAQFIAQEADNIGSQLTMSVKPGEKNEEARKEMFEYLEFTEKYVIGPYAVGEELSFADAVLLPHLDRLVQVVGKDALEKAPKLRRIFDELTAKEAVKAVLAAGGDAEGFKAFAKTA